MPPQPLCLNIAGTLTVMLFPNLFIQPFNELTLAFLKSVTNGKTYLLGLGFEYYDVTSFYWTIFHKQWFKKAQPSQCSIYKVNLKICQINIYNHFKSQMELIQMERESITDCLCMTHIYWWTTSIVHLIS